ncbi:MAG: hypothetical protein ABIS29_06370 [Vicinamibacterales bacterium]
MLKLVKSEPTDEDFNAILEDGEVVFYQDWDSGGPGAGAGRVSVYRFRGLFYVDHDAGMEGPYATKEEAVQENGAATIGDATETIWDSTMGVIFQR